MIARVIYNRLGINMPLQIDATHIYNVPPEELEPDGAITRLREVDTPWNTFTNTGLPATPIANPGRASIEAALHPAPNPSPGSAECAGLAGRPVPVAVLRDRRRAGQPRLLGDGRAVRGRSSGRRRRRLAVIGSFGSDVAALIGSPVGHSLSPVIHQAAFDAAGVDWRYVAFDVPAGRADEALAAMRVLGIAGLSVTTPHKEQVADVRRRSGAGRRRRCARSTRSSSRTTAGSSATAPTATASSPPCTPTASTSAGCTSPCSVPGPRRAASSPPSTTPAPAAIVVRQPDARARSPTSSPSPR